MLQLVGGLDPEEQGSDTFCRTWGGARAVRDWNELSSQKKGLIINCLPIAAPTRLPSGEAARLRLYIRTGWISELDTVRQCGRNGEIRSPAVIQRLLASRHGTLGNHDHVPGKTMLGNELRKILGHFRHL